MLTRFRNFSIRKDSYFNSFQTTNVNKIPRYLDLPDVGDEPGMIGDIILNITERSLCYHNGITWECLTGGTGGPVSLINVGGGAESFIIGTGPDPFELRTLVSLNPDLTITQTLDTIEFDLLVNPGGVSSLLNVGIGANPDPNDRFIVYNGQPNLPNTDPAEIRTLRGALNQAVATLEAEDVIINDPLTNPNPETDGNVVGTEIVDNLIVQVSVAGSDLNDGVSAPVATLERALEVVRFRNFVETVLIEIGSGTFDLSENFLNFNVGTRGREKNGLLIRGVAEPVGQLITGVTGVEGTIDQLLELSHPSFSATLQGQMISLTYTDNSGNVETQRLLLGEYNPVTNRMTVCVSTGILEIDLTQPISYQLFNRQTILRLPNNTVWNGDKFPVTFQNIVFENIDNFTILQVNNMHLIFVNIVYNLNCIIYYNDCNYETFIDADFSLVNAFLNNQVPFEHRLTGIYYNCLNNFINNLFGNCLVFTGNSFINGDPNDRNNLFECQYANCIVFNQEYSFLNNGNQIYLVFDSFCNFNNIRFQGCLNIFDNGGSVLFLTRNKIDNTDFQAPQEAATAIKCVENSYLLISNSLINGGSLNNIDYVNGIISDLSNIQIVNTQILNMSRDIILGEDSAGILCKLSNILIQYSTQQVPMFDNMGTSAIVADNCNLSIEFEQTTLINVYSNNIVSQDYPAILLNQTKFNIIGSGQNSILIENNSISTVSQIILNESNGLFRSFLVSGSQNINSFVSARTSNIYFENINNSVEAPFQNFVFDFDNCNCNLIGGVFRGNLGGQIITPIFMQSILSHIFISSEIRDYDTVFDLDSTNIICDGNNTSGYTLCFDASNNSNILVDTMNIGVNVQTFADLEFSNIYVIGTPINNHISTTMTLNYSNAYLTNSNINTLGSWDGTNTGSTVVLTNNSNLVMVNSSITNYWERGIDAQNNCNIVFSVGNITGLSNTEQPPGQSINSVRLQSNCQFTGILANNEIGLNYGRGSNGLQIIASKIYINCIGQNAIRDNEISSINLIDSECTIFGSFQPDPPPGVQNFLYMYSVAPFSQNNCITAVRSKINAKYLMCNLDRNEPQPTSPNPLTTANVTTTCILLETSDFNGEMIVATGNGGTTNNTSFGLVARNNSNVVINGFYCSYHAQIGVTIERNSTLNVSQDFNILQFPPFAGPLIIANRINNLVGRTNCLIYLENTPLTLIADPGPPTFIPTATSVVLENTRCELNNCEITFSGDTNNDAGVRAKDSYFATNNGIRYDIVPDSNTLGSCLLLDNCVVKIINEDTGQDLLIGGTGTGKNVASFVNAVNSDIYFEGNMNMTDFNDTAITLENCTFRLDGVNKPPTLSTISGATGISNLTLFNANISTIILDSVIMTLDPDQINNRGLILNVCKLVYLGDGNSISTRDTCIEAENSNISASNLQVSTNNASVSQLLCENSNLFLNGITHVGAATNGILANNSSTGFLTDITSNNGFSGSCIVVDNNSNISVKDGEIRFCQSAGIRVLHGSSITLRDTVLDSNTGVPNITDAGISVLYSSKATLLAVTGSNSNLGAIARWSSTITVDQLTTVNGGPDTFIGTLGPTPYPILNIGVSDYASTPSENCSLTRFP